MVVIQFYDDCGLYINQERGGKKLHHAITKSLSIKFFHHHNQNPPGFTSEPSNPIQCHAKIALNHGLIQKPEAVRQGSREDQHTNAKK
ncbi:excinuclease ABC subunit C [Sesbania bispinosa]|nr:excinuclease ABC subunit C [Sesbania bispinosa]